MLDWSELAKGLGSFRREALRRVEEGLKAATDFDEPPAPKLNFPAPQQHRDFTRAQAYNPRLICSQGVHALYSTESGTDQEGLPRLRL